MVQVRAHQPVNTDGSINLEAWLDHVQNLVPGLDRQGLLEACEFARESEQRAIAAQNSWAEGTSSFQTGLEIAEILADLKLDQESLVAAVIYRGVREGKIRKDISVPVVMAMIRGTVTCFMESDILYKNGLTYEQGKEEMVQIIMKGIRAA